VRPTEDARLTFDHGPLGMAPLFNHGHADALSVTLWAKGVPILVDPGTFRYNGVPEHRAYFKGTSAHNTVAIDGQDQAVQETGFIWSKPFTTRLLFAQEHRGAFLAAAEHDGYARLKDPVWHRRGLAVDDRGGILIWDRFRGRGAHAFQLNFHLHPDVEAERTADAWRLRHGDAVVHLALLTADLDFALVRGRRAPLLGWYSPAYGVLQETSTLSLTVHGRPEEVSFFTSIRVGSGFDRNDFLERALWHLQAA
jgi:hypothetical protein